MKAQILKGDTVMVRRGRERGKRGVVKAIFPGLATATVEGVNVVKRHTKPQQQSGNMGASTRTGGIVEKEAPLPLSALQYVCEACKVPTRLRRGESKEHRRARICVKCGEPARESAKGA
ncbi:MAG TPA: 50S ribosomal protein L24 [Candidatus Tyrphobacter sp.]